MSYSPYDYSNDETMFILDNENDLVRKIKHLSDEQFKEFFAYFATEVQDTPCTPELVNAAKEFAYEAREAAYDAPDTTMDELVEIACGLAELNA